MTSLALRIGSLLYRNAYPLYRPLYGAYKRYSDRQERRILRSVVPKGGTVVDVGANIGIYTRFLAGLVGDGGTVYAFEPAPDTFSHLEQNVRHCVNVRAVNAAVGEQGGEIVLFLSNELNVDNRTFDSGDARRRCRVPCVNLDAFLGPDFRVDTLKIDVQGFELSVLRGAERLIAGNSDLVILMEYWPYGLGKAGTRPAVLVDFLYQHGLEPRVISGGKLMPFRDGAVGTGEADFVNLLVARPARWAALAGIPGHP